MKAVVLAGGKGRRLLPYTHIIPKPLMPIGDKPILEIILLQMKRAGIEDVVLTVGYLADLLRLFFQNGERLGMNIEYSYETVPLGTSGPIANIHGLDETFLVTNGDVLTTLNFKELIEFHKKEEALITIAVNNRKVKVDLGVVVCDQTHRVTDYIEKPSYDFLVSMGIYVFEPRVLTYIHKGEHLDFPALVLRLVSAGEKVSSYVFDGYWEDLGRPDDYQRASEDFERLRKTILPED